MIKNLAWSMAKRLSNILDSQQNVEIYAYALGLLFMVILNLTLVMLAALYLGIIPTTLAFLAVFIPFRGLGGGVHLSTFPRCIVVGSILMLGSAYLAAAVDIRWYTLAVLFALVLVFTFICVIRWAPASAGKNSFYRPQKVERQKRYMLVTALIWACCAVILVWGQYNTLALAVILGALVSTVLISPLGFVLMGFIDKMLNYLGKEVVNP